MTEYHSEFLQQAKSRGYLYQGTDMEALDELALAGPVTAYIGYDCTGPSFHAGHLLSIMLLRLFQKTGHKPIVLMGGGTTKIADPTGKDKQRQPLTTRQINKNLARLKTIFSRYLTFGDGPTDAIMVNNNDWLRRLRYIPFLQKYGSHFSVNRMLKQDSVRDRLEREQPLSFLEFNYSLLQAYDFVELSRRFGCSLQMGGSDQWGNIVAGVDLGRRIEQKAFYGLTIPLLTTASGGKMGKTEGGAVWLDGDMLSPYKFWQFWRNIEDADVERYLYLLTDLSAQEISRLSPLIGPDPNAVKKILATEITRLCHGEDAASEAAETARRTFEEGTSGDALPTIDIKRSDLEAGIAITKLLVDAELCSSGGEARRMIRGGGAKLNDIAVGNELDMATVDDLFPNGTLKLSAGKKRHVLIRAV
jgi:tyrosyl-tRNA synthetase